MSESESSSGSSSVTDRSGSPSPGPASNPPTAGVDDDDGVRDSYESYMDPFDAKPPEYRAEGLIILWRAGHDGHEEEASFVPQVPVRDFDIVVVHGLHGARRPPWKNPGSGDSHWVHDLGPRDGRTIMSFGYDPLRILSGSRTRDSIRRASIRLLDELKKERAPIEKARPIMFVAHDIGGTIVKDALTYAGLFPSLYGEIFDYTRVLLFYGCPHQCVDLLDMEDRLSRFLLSHFDRDAPQLQGTVAAAKGLAKAVTDVNDLFIDSKHVYRSHVISIFNNDDESQIDKVFDSYAGTLGVPFERRIAGGVSAFNDMLVIEPHLFKINGQIYPDDNIIEQERVLLSIARPTPALTTADDEAHPFSWLGQNDIYKSWSSQKVPQLLYLHGSSGVREAAEFAFYNLDQSLRSKENVNEMVLYFTFDRFDIRHDTTADMLTTFLAQIICHNPSLSEFVVNQFERLAVDRSWSDYDLLTWFEYYRVRGQVDGVSCVINHFEECETESRKAFLNLFTKLSKSHERPWRIIVTSRERGALSKELKDWPSIDLDSAAAPSKEGVTEDSAMVFMSSSRLFRLRPDLRDDRAVQEELEQISALDVSVRDLVLAQVSQHSAWPQNETVESLFGSVRDASVEAIFDRIMAALPDPALALRALSWIVFAVRPLTVWELGMALFIGSEGDDGKKASPDPGFIDDVVSKLLRWFAGVIVLEQHDIRLASPYFRDLIKHGSGTKEKSASTPTNHWRGISVGAANKDIVDTCINFLLRDEVKEYLEKVYGQGKKGVMDLPSLGDRSNLCSFAALYWPVHLAKIPADMDPARFLQKFIESKSVSSWSKAQWAHANPITRSPAAFDSIYPLLTALGFADLAESLRVNDEDISEGLIEACLNGYLQNVNSLLNRVKHSEAALQRALIAAGSYGDETIWKRVIQHARENYEGFSWPPSLLSRAAWLGLKDVVLELLEVGCDPNPANTIQGATPLHLAARNGHYEVVKVLLDHKADANHTGQYGRTPVAVATVFGHAEVIELLVKEGGADINAKDDDNLTATYSGSLWGNWKAVETLLKLGADPNIGDSAAGVPQWNPLVCAVEEGHNLCVQALLEAGADPNFVGLAGTPIRYAVSSGRIGICRMLIEKGAALNHPSIDPPILMYAINSPRIETGELRLEIVKLLLSNDAKLDVVDEEDETALYRACCVEDADPVPLISYLLDRGADINGRSKDGETALHIAVRRNNKELVKLLIGKGADVNPAIPEHNRDGSPLHLAVYNPEILGLLLEHKADPTVATQNVPPPLILATLAGKLESIQLLLDHGARLEDQDPTFGGWTALTYAASYGYSDPLRLLADAGADINHILSDGRTPTHLALQESSLPALLEFRPDVHIKDKNGDAPLHWIEPFTPLENVKLLVRAGARLDMQNGAGLTPLSKAVQRADAAVVEYLLSKSGTDVVNSVSRIHGSALHLACGAVRRGLVELLVGKGADVNLAVSSMAGTPLQSAILFADNVVAAMDGSDDGTGNDAVAGIVDFLIDSGADVSKVAGHFGTAVAAAAIHGSAALLTTLLEKGARPDVPDPMGRLPIHLASVRGADHFGILLDADGDVLVRDKVGRTALHWAAQGGAVAVVERILDIAGDEIVDQPDVNGWTPLFWAARGCGTHFSSGSAEKQAEVIRKLVQRGASTKKKSRLPGKEDWLPIDVARYHQADEEVLELLETEVKRKPKAADKKDGEAEDGEKRGQNPPVRRLKDHYPAFCACCLFNIAGLCYSCDECNFSLCYKCYGSREAFHPAHHTLTEVGPEYEPLPEESQSSSQSEDDDSDSDDTETDEDSDEEESHISGSDD